MTASWWLNLANFFSPQAIERFFFYLFILFLPTQFGKHFWPSFSLIMGQRIDYLSLTVSITDLLVIVLLLCSLLRKEIHVHRYFLFVVLFFSLTITLSQSPFAGWYWLLKFLEMSFVGWYITKHKAERSLWAVMAIALLLESSLAIAQYIHQGSIGGIFYFLGERTFTSNTPGIANASLNGQLVLRPYGTFPHPNVLAGFLVIGMILMVGFFQSRLKHSREMVWSSHLLVLTTVTIGTIALLLTLSRVAISTWLVAGIIFLVSQNIFVSKIKVFLSSIFFLGLGFLLLVFSPSLVSRFSEISFTEETVVVREILMFASLKMIETHSLFGVGPNNFLPSLPLFATNYSLIQPVHNIYLLWVSETGIGGGCIAGIFLLSLFRKMLQHMKDSANHHIRLFVVAFCCTLFIGLFDHYFLTIQQGQLLLAVVIGLAWGNVSSYQAKR